ncbi:DUF6603 domain-containing protein [Micromonospora sp. NPDC003776]
MSEPLHTTVVAQAVSLLDPLADAAANLDAQARLLTAVGWDISALAGADPATLAQALQVAQHTVTDIRGLLATGITDLEQAVTCLLDAAAAVTAIVDLVHGWHGPASTGGLSSPPSADDDPYLLLVNDLVNFLLDAHLAARLPRLRTVLDLIGVRSTVTPAHPVTVNGRVARDGRARPYYDITPLGDLLRDPVATVRTRVFGPTGAPGVPDDIADLLGPVLADWLRQLGLLASYGTPGAAQDSVLSAEQKRVAAHLLHVAWTADIDPEGEAAVWLRLALGLTRDTGPGGTGPLVAVLRPDGGAGGHLDLGQWAIDWTVTGATAPLVIGQDGARFDPPDQPAAAGAALEVTYGRPTPGHPALRFGDPGAIRLEIDQFAVQAKAHIDASGPDGSLTLRLVGARLLIEAGKDGFLGAVLPAQPVQMDLDVGLSWSPKTGLTFLGSVGLDKTFPVGYTLGPLTINQVRIALAAGASTGVELRLTSDLTLRLGPVTAVAAGLGLRAALTRADQGGAFGPLDVRLELLAPTGIGLSVDAPVVTGGGFLLADPATGQYAGGLHLEFEKLTLNAIGLLTTHLPDGSRGMSLLVIVQASGFTPIQLGFGFTLNGVGGLLAINRTVAVDVLRAGVRNRTLDAILFSPDDPTPRAPQIISTLQSVFPPAVNQYVFGPMAKIGWGAPVTLVTIEIALILELPAPLRLILLGRIRAALPDPDHAIVNINLDVVGVVDFDRSELSVDASLYDSRVGPFALTGDMAARANWGANPDFAMALGGFHPAFTPPPGFPALRRLTLALSTGDNPRLRMETYLALTSNTVQVGARLELYVGLGPFALEGGLGFDTLIQFSPFRLLAEIYAHLALKSGGSTLMGLDIHVHLTGPAPWVLWGEASFSIFFFSITLPFRAQFGRAEDVPAIERTDVWPVLRDSLTAEANWSAHLPPQGGRLVVPRDGAGDGELTAHPLGALTVSQSLVPLERILGLFGSVPPKDYDRFAVASVTGLSVTGAATQYFAPSQFRQMSDAEKLASPAYERMVSGVHLAPSTAIIVGYVQETPLDYEQSVILDVAQPAAQRLDDRYTPGGDVVAALAQHGPAATAPSREQGTARFAPPSPGPTVGEPTYVVVDRDTLTPVPQDGSDGSYTAAAELLRRHPDRGDLQIVRAEELELV